MKKLILLGLLLIWAGCTTPEKVVILPNPYEFASNGGLMSGSVTPRVEYRCPLCAEQYQTEFMAQQCIDKHDD